MGSTKGSSGETGSRVVPEGESPLRDASLTVPREDSMISEGSQLRPRSLAPIVSPDPVHPVIVDTVPPPIPQTVELSQVPQESGSPEPSGSGGDGGGGGDGVDSERKPKRVDDNEAFNSICQTIDGDDDDQSKRRSWKVLGKLALLAHSMNAHTIDIYHDRKLNTSRFMIHPNSKFRRAWEILTVCLVLYVCTMVRATEVSYAGHLLTLNTSMLRPDPAAARLQFRRLE
ncbi:hypothetical protein BBJ28_00007969 [Nothophytophthora sp. Chile5]|nr:hypothetical protein BBJ28_00007969 [Nothophytophthora sp. Chile5]